MKFGQINKKILIAAKFRAKVPNSLGAILKPR